MATGELESFRRFIFSTIDQLIGALDGLDEKGLNWRPPAPETNSLYGIAMHVLGNAEENLLATLCGQPFKRNRPGEFAARGKSANDASAEWMVLRDRIDRAFAELPPDALDRERRHPRRGAVTGREVLQVVSRHAAEHWGEAQLTKNLLKATIGGA